MAKAKITSDARGFDAESAGKLLDRIYACEPLLTGEVVDMIEERMQSDFGVARRIGLAAASKGWRLVPFDRLNGPSRCRRYS